MNEAARQPFLKKETPHTRIIFCFVLFVHHYCYEYSMRKSAGKGEHSMVDVLMVEKISFADTQYCMLFSGKDETGKDGGILILPFQSCFLVYSTVVVQSSEF